VSTGLNPEQVQSLAAAIGLAISAEDLAEVTVRLNAMLTRLTALDRSEAIGDQWPDHGGRTVSGAVLGSSRRSSWGAEVGASELHLLGARALGQILQRRKVSATEVQAFLTRIEALDSKLRAFITVTADTALDAARRADAELARGKVRGPLHGIPFAVKDALWTKGIRTTNGSRLFTDFIPERDATAVARLRAAGGILLGKLNMMELGFGPTLKPPFGVPRNPWDLGRTPGGSSSGSAAAVAAGLVPVSLGADTGGSIRLPASFCGIVGLKPTAGRVSRFGLMGICERFDTAGPLAATAADCALVCHAIAGYDPRDRHTSRRPVPDYAAVLGTGAQGMRVGVVRELLESAVVQPDVRERVEAALTLLERAGAVVERVSIPLIASSSEIYTAIAEPEAAARYRRYLLERSPDIDVLPRRRLLAASLLPASLAARVAGLAEQLRAQVEEVLTRVDILASPTTPTAATPIPSAASIGSAEEAWTTAVAGRSLLTNPFNVTGHPALSVPCGFLPENLPVGLQLIGRAFGEKDILRVADTYQSLAGWPSRRPPV
jgi:aspartyl-tRNA(Asn)/glutamyl-tRNA(Gln) amidotransferase subunit A